MPRDRRGQAVESTWARWENEAPAARAAGGPFQASEGASRLDAVWFRSTVLDQSPHGPEDLVFIARVAGRCGSPTSSPAASSRPCVRRTRSSPSSTSTAAPTPLPDALRLYDPRHTVASLMIRRGAGVKAVLRQLGHATASITLDVYGHLFPDELDALAGRMERARTEALASLAWTSGCATAGRCRSVSHLRGAGGGARTRPHPASPAKVGAVNAV
jgi:integrase